MPFDKDVVGMYYNLNAGDPTKWLYAPDLSRSVQNSNGHGYHPGNLAALASSPNGIVPMAEIERQTILSALEQLKGDKLMTARMLGIGKTTLYRKLKEYGAE